MNKKIKIIELLNKIANGEEVPKEIKFQNIIYVFNKECNQYYERGKGSYFDNKLKFDKTIEWNFYGDYLNEEVEVLEDSLEDNLEDNTEEIEELDNWFIDERKECREFDIPAINLCFKKHTDKINELVRAYNKLKKDLNKEHCCNCGVEITDENRALSNICNECKYGIDWEEKSKWES